MTRCITPVLLAIGLAGCGLGASDGPEPGDIDEVVDIVDDFAVATGDGDEEGSDIDLSDDRAVTTGDDEQTIDDFTHTSDTTGPGTPGPSTTSRRPTITRRDAHIQGAPARLTAGHHRP